MRKEKVDHIIRAAAKIVGQKKFVLVGSDAVIVRSKHIPLEMMQTPEIDIYAPDADDIETASDLITSNIGTGTDFHVTHGYYGDGVSPVTSKMPNDWRTRAIDYRGKGCRDIEVIVPEQNDIALAKLLAWREKDVEWLKQGARAKLLNPQTMADRLDLMPQEDADRGVPPRAELENRIRTIASACKIVVRFEYVLDVSSSPKP